MTESDYSEMTAHMWHLDPSTVRLNLTHVRDRDFVPYIYSWTYLRYAALVHSFLPSYPSTACWDAARLPRTLCAF